MTLIFLIDADKRVKSRVKSALISSASSAIDVQIIFWNLILYAQHSAESYAIGKSRLHKAPCSQRYKRDWEIAVTITPMKMA